MKHILLLLPLSILLFITSCTNKPVTAFVSGVILNPVNDVISLIDLSDELFQSDTAYLDENGNFEFNMELDDAGFYMIRHGRKRNILYLAPGDKLKFEVEAENLGDNLNFSGTGQDINVFLMNEKTFLAELKPANDLLYGLNEELFIRKTADILKSWQDYINEQENLSAEFKETESTVALYDWALTRIYYQDAHRYFADEDSFKVSDNYYSFVDDLDLNKAELLRLHNFRNFIQHNYTRIGNEMYTADSNYANNDLGEILSNYEAAKSAYNNSDIKSYALFKVMKDQLDYYGIKDMNELYQNFLSDCNNESYKNYITEKYEKWLTIEPGKLAEDFTYPDMDGNEFSLSDFKGKYVYLDVWATWCGPCKLEIPHLDTLVNDLKENNVEIISISVDEDKEAWVEMISSDQPAWLQLYAGSWNTAVANFFQIRSIPRFILLDRDGKIIDANAQRPSENIRDQILALEGI